MKDYGRYSYWLETCGDDLTPRPPLDGSIDVDVAILGAGFSGLWTAYYLLEREPGLKVALLEGEIAGFGGSGRNGGGVGNRFSVGLRGLADRYGRQGAVDTFHALDATVGEIERAATAEGIAMDFTLGGYLRLARGPQQVATVEADVRTYQELGLGEHIEYLSAEQVAERVQVRGVNAGHFSKNSGKLQPAKLARGLARAVERRGATIYEQTRVTDYTTGAYPALHTERGHARAKVIVLAGEAYLARLPKLRRRVLPVYSLITATEPLAPGDWEQIGWEAREGLSSAAFTVNYLTKTVDGRILFGGRGAPYHLRSNIVDGYDTDGPTHAMLQQSVREWFPMLNEVKFTHTWGGPLGWPRDWVPNIGFDPKENLATAFGYTGTGVAPTNLAGRIVADLITRRQSDVSQLPWVNHRSRNWEPEPLRWAGVRYVQRGFMRLDSNATASGVAPNGKSLVERLSRH